MTTTELKKRTPDKTEVTREAHRPTCLPPVDVVETDEAFRIVADVPGAGEGDIEISLDRNLLTLRAAQRQSAPAGHEPAYREYTAANFERSFTLGDEVDRDGVKAALRNGVLVLTLPKVKAVQPRRIAVKAD